MKRSISIVLLAALLLTSCSLGSVGADTTAAGGADTTAPAEETVNYYDGLEDLDFGGYEFTVISYDHESWPIYIAPLEEDGTLVNDATVKRNREVEELLNVKIAEYKVAGTSAYNQTYQNSILAGDDVYDLCAYWSTDSQAVYITENLVFDWQKIPYVNLDAPWYSQSANEAYRVAGKQFFAVSDFTYPVQQQPRILFNKGMMDDFKLEYPYQAVYDGKWTYDMMMNYCKNIYTDMNGNGSADDQDRYGFVTNNTWTSLFVFSADETPVVCGDDGFMFNLFSQRISDIMDDLTAQKYNPDIYHTPSGNNYHIFNEGRALFEAYGSTPEALREIEFDYGYLPYPKYDDTQKEYTAFAAGGMMSVPITATNIERTGAIIEALSAGSQKYVEDAFVQSYFEGKILRDEDSVQVYRMMRDQATFVFSHNIDPSNQLTNFKFYISLLNDSTLGAASYWASIKDSVEAAYEELYQIASAQED